VLLIIVFNTSLAIQILTANIYYLGVILVFLLLFFATSYEKKHFNYLMLVLLFAGLISVLVNEVPKFFRPFERLAIFFILLCLIGPLVVSQKLSYFRLKLFHLFNKTNLVICTLSLLGLITGIYKGITVNRFGNARVDFTGLYNHSMTLGPMAGVAILSGFFYYYKTNNKKLKIVFVIGIVFSFLAAVAAGSRGALVASICGLLFFFYKMNQGQMSKYITSIFIVIGIGVVSFPLWQDRTEYLFDKIESRKDSEGHFDSRTQKWGQRIYEFKTSPLFGIGFASINVNMYDNFNRDTGVIEPGSSWLGVLSMVGVFGFIPLLFLFFQNFIFIFKDRKNKKYSAFIGGLLVLFTVHMVFEGYIFASGSFLFFYIWLLLGVIEIYKKYDISILAK
jgi:hypothetical protein